MNNKLFSMNGDLEWQWDNNPVSILTAMKWWTKDQEKALVKLKEGQVDNENAQNLYDTAANTITNFWHSVFYKTWSKADFSALESQLKWQIENDWNSINASWEAWNEQPRQELWAYYNLLWGQREDPAVLKVYRACWNEDKDKVMDLVKQVSWKGEHKK